MATFLAFSLLLLTKTSMVESASGSASGFPLSDYLKWKYTPMNPNCTNVSGGQNFCKDVRTCDFAVVSIMLGGWPTICGWVGKGVPKVCCGLPLVLGERLMKRVEAEKARKRKCGRTAVGLGLSETEKKFFELRSKLPSMDLSDPDMYDPPLDLDYNKVVLPMGGVPSRQGDFPWMVALYKGSSFWCGGALIDRVHILTAAHCVAESGVQPDPSEFTVRIGNIHMDNGVPFSLDTIMVHEDHDPQQHYHDIAILTLKEEILVPEIAHICLPNERLSTMDLSGENTTLLGWGDTEFGGDNTPLLHIVDDIPVVTNEECKKAYRHVGRDATPHGITDNFICAGLWKGGKDACQQDSGGPLMYKYNNADPSSYYSDISWMLVGIVSFGFRCGEPGFPGVYTRVSSYMDWIIENTSS